jgi:signal peptidase II
MRCCPGRQFGVFLVIAAAGCALDLWTKDWIFGRLGMPDPNNAIPIWRGVFSLTTSLNEGALFGMGQGMTLVFAGLSIAALIGIVYWLFIRGGCASWFLTIALAMITGGILGNLYDRLGLPGLKWNFPADRLGEPVYAVRDWLHLQILRDDGSVFFDWPVFNIADSLLVCGSVLLVFYGLKSPDTGAVGRPTSSEPQPAASA